MVSSNAKTVVEYLKSLPTEKREVIGAVRKVILKNIPKGYVEVMNWGMIVYEVPLATYSITYNKQPIGIAALAAQKNYFSLYLMNVYGNKETEKWFRDEFNKAGKKLDMGKSCVRFKKLDDLPLDVIGKTIAKTTVKDCISLYEKSRKK